MTELEPVLAELFAGDRKVTFEELPNISQRRVAETFLRQVAERNARTGNTEQKQLEITLTKMGLIFITVEYGMPKDKGTYAEIFCRDRHHVVIRSRGGIELLNARRKSWSHGLWCAVHEVTN